MSEHDITYYKTEKWLNPKTSPSTGSVVCYDGQTEFSDGIGRNAFLQISDCHNIVRLHKCYADSVGDFIAKLRSLRDEINRFIKHLEDEPRE